MTRDSTDPDTMVRAGDRGDAAARSILAGPALTIAHATVVEAIMAQAERAPDRIAVAWSGGQPWTYAQTIMLADAVAYHLTSHGIARGERVAVYLPRVPQLVAALLGVMRAGAAFVPLDTLHPPARLEYMARRAGARHIVVMGHADMPPGLATGMTCCELASMDPRPAAGWNPPELLGSDLAYVLFTSGSTGQPKGVRTLHSNLINDLASIQRDPGIDADDVFGAFTTVTFDASIHELLLPLMVGARLVMASEEELIDPTAATALQRRFPMTLLEVSPTHLRLMLASGRIDELRNIKLWSGGEALPRDVANAVLPHCRELWNTYGPTETTIESTIHRVTHGTGPVPIGKPIANTTTYILDGQRRAVAQGEVGELWIGGAGVADGYLDDPEQTAERFVEDPFAADGSFMYRTGDLAMLLDGELYFHGRIDEQINLNGARIEPGDVEAVARAEPGVRHAVLVARELPAGDLLLILYVAADPDPDLPMRLRARLRKHLPPYMLPRHIELIDALPRTASGKIDRKALPPPDLSAANPARPAPPSAGGKIVPDAWSPLVALQPHGRRTPLFLVHDESGDTVTCLPLARALGVDQPVHGINAIGLDGCMPPLASIPDSAALHVPEIRRLQPKGPYLLAGVGIGGWIAREIAVQLLALGEQTVLLAMIDSDPVAMGRFARLIATLSPQRWLDGVRSRHLRATGRTPPPPLCRREVRRALRQAVATYAIPAYSGRVLRFHSVGTGHIAGDPRSAEHQAMEVFELQGEAGALIENPDLFRKLRDALACAHSSPAMGSQGR